MDERYAHANALRESVVVYDERTSHSPNIKSLEIQFATWKLLLFSSFGTGVSCINSPKILYSKSFKMNWKQIYRLGGSSSHVGWMREICTCT